VSTHSNNQDDSLSGTAYTDEEIETPNVSYTYDSYYARITTMGLDGGGDHDQSRACSDSRFTSALALMRVLVRHTVTSINERSVNRRKYSNDGSLQPLRLAKEAIQLDFVVHCFGRTRIGHLVCP
jgi:hypothetical protein